MCLGWQIEVLPVDDETTLANLLTVWENVAFFGDLVLRLPEIVHSQTDEHQARHPKDVKGSERPFRNPRAQALTPPFAPSLSSYLPGAHFTPPPMPLLALQLSHYVANTLPLCMPSFPYPPLPSHGLFLYMAAPL